jgi:hypothetical protein
MIQLHSILSVLDQRLASVLGTAFTSVCPGFCDEWVKTDGSTCIENSGSTGVVVTTSNSGRYGLTFHVDVANINSQSFLRLVGENSWVLFQTSVHDLDMMKAIANMRRIMSFDIEKTCYYSLCVESGSLMFDTGGTKRRVGLRIYDDKPPRLFVGESSEPYTLRSAAPDPRVFIFLALGSPCTLDGNIGDEVCLKGCPNLTSGQPITMTFVHIDSSESFSSVESRWRAQSRAWRSARANPSLNDLYPFFVRTPDCASVIRYMSDVFRGGRNYRYMKLNFLGLSVPTCIANLFSWYCIKETCKKKWLDEDIDRGEVGETRYVDARLQFYTTFTFGERVIYFTWRRPSLDVLDVIFTGDSALYASDESWTDLQKRCTAV